MDFVNKAIGSVTTEEKKEAGEGLVEKAEDTARVGFGKAAGATADVIGATMDFSEREAVRAEDLLRGYEIPEHKKREEGFGGLANSNPIGKPEQKKHEGGFGGFGGLANSNPIGRAFDTSK